MAPCQVFLTRLCPQDNDVEREFQIHRTERDYALAEFWKWFLAFLIGVCMGVLGFCVDWGIGRLNDAKFKSVQLEILSTREHPESRRPFCHSCTSQACYCLFQVSADGDSYGK